MKTMMLVVGVSMLLIAFPTEARQVSCPSRGYVPFHKKVPGSADFDQTLYSADNAIGNKKCKRACISKCERDWESEGCLSIDYKYCFQGLCYFKPKCYCKGFKRTVAESELESSSRWFHVNCAEVDFET